ncbi:hypothetical protein CJF42_24325 [Pseudoalteromonas sp. NBT06-2]|uniref:hypothetical protein n=1 Tax=Pseudoalteromonas sp. NBT06-2 TaxID=2025950 RepID=UPI000BA74A92|nr:hypothetical protein [Pseudoalteromonas sp. NBT06-2]PAJ71876.1 hypothetical protein CJF42_24325 [Pseudoalteromonas sp. NBT06-2]
MKNITIELSNVEAKKMMRSVSEAKTLFSQVVAAFPDGDSDVITAFREDIFILTELEFLLGGK